MSCPKCKSKNILIIASNVLTFKCEKCGYTWTINTEHGLVETPSGLKHWTEVMYYKELAIEKVKELVSEGKSIKEILEILKNEFKGILSQDIIRNVCRKGVLFMLDVLKLRNPELYKKYIEELRQL